MFSETPIFKQWPEDAEYLGTWYGHDCSILDGSLIVRFGSEPHEYASYPSVGRNPYHPTSRVGGLGAGRTRCEVDIEGIDGYNKNSGRATICALAFLGRRYLDG